MSLSLLADDAFDSLLVNCDGEGADGSPGGGGIIDNADRFDGRVGGMAAEPMVEWLIAPCTVGGTGALSAFFAAFVVL